MNLNEAESWAGLGRTRPYGSVSDRRMKGGIGETEKEGKDEGVGQSNGMDEESLVSRMKKEQKEGFTNTKQRNSGG